MKTYGIILKSQSKETMNQVVKMVKSILKAKEPEDTKVLSMIKATKNKAMGTGSGGAGVVGVGMGTYNQSDSYKKKHGKKNIKKGVKIQTGKEYVDRGYNQTTEAKVTAGYPKGESKGMSNAGGKKTTNAERGTNAYSEAKATAGYPKGVSHGMKADKSVKILDGKEYIDRNYNQSTEAKVSAGYPKGTATTKR
jgi:hypothetical protein